MVGVIAESYHLVVVVACHIAALVHRVAAAAAAVDMHRTVHHIVAAADEEERRVDDKGLDRAADADRVVAVGIPADIHPHPCLRH